MKNVLAVDIGGTNLRVGIVDISNHRLVDWQLMSSKLLSSEEGQSHRLLINILSIYMKSAPSVDAICIGFPSILSSQKGFVYNTPNILGLNNIAIGKIIEDHFGIQTIIEKDVNLLLRFDIEELQLLSKNAILGFYIGTGLGSAIYLNNSIYTGSQGAAGEIGHTPLSQGATLCGCGNTGCIETVASGRYLVEIQKRYFPDTDFEEIFLYQSSHPKIKEFINLLSLPLAIEVNILDPEYVVLGGGVVSMENFPQDFLLQCVKAKLRRPYPYESVTFKLSRGGETAGLLGASYHIKGMIARGTLELKQESSHFKKGEASSY